MKFFIIIFSFCNPAIINHIDKALTSQDYSLSKVNMENTNNFDSIIKLLDNDINYNVVDDYYKTTVDSIYAIGDVIDRIQLTPVALAEGMAVAKTLFRNQPSSADYEYIPTAVFSQPELGTVGLTEEEARKLYDEVAIYKSSFRTLKHTLTDSDEKTLMKMVVDKKSDRVLGVHMVGAHSGEILQGVAVALRAGATKSVFDTTIGIHPTSAEELVTMREPVPESIEK